MAHYPAIIHPEALIKCLENHEVRLVDVFNPTLQDRVFIPGALHLPTAALIEGTPPSPGKLPSIAQLESVFGYLGYMEDQIIVVSDHEGGGWAGRLAWTLDIIGHTRWLYLDGGIHAWQQQGYTVVDKPTEAVQTKPKLQLNLEPLVELEELMSNLESSNLVVWDVRSREEFLGLKPTAQRNGHIPGAVNIDWLDLMEQTNALRLREDLRALLASQGITPDKRVVTHCQTHHRSGLSYMVARLLGFQNIRAYAGSWSEWGNRFDTPIES
ncbi:MAG: sulfurtransferase [Gammaproteobacteria bacterium]|nr:sulfurtransferase [Gammaproteobacteria bacterium]